MATLATQSITRAGAAPSYAAATGGGDRFTPGQRTFLHVKNGSGGALTVTVSSQSRSVIPNVSITSLAVSVPAAGERMIGPLPPEIFMATDGTGLGDITYSGVTSLTVGVFDLTS
jgi:hypothetical protein